MLASTRLASSLRPYAEIPRRCARALATSSPLNGTGSELEAHYLPGFVAKDGSRAGSSRQSRTSYKVETQKIAGSPAECLFILNALENKFGAARLFRFQRNLDFPSQYAPYFVANFHDHPDLPKLGGDDATVTIEVPKKLTQKPLETALNGGVGLKDIQPYLHPGSSSSSTAESSHAGEATDADTVNAHSAASGSSVDHTVINVKISCMGESYEYRGVDRKSTASKETQDNIGRTFVRWGGFSSSATAEVEAPHMQSAIGHWRGVLGPVNFKQLLDERVDMAVAPTLTVQEQDTDLTISAEEPEKVEAPAPEPAPVIEASRVEEPESWVPQTSLSDLFPMPAPGTQAIPTKAYNIPPVRESSRTNRASKTSHTSLPKPASRPTPKPVQKAKPAPPPHHVATTKPTPSSAPSGRRNVEIKQQQPPARRAAPARPSTPTESGPGVMTKMRDFFGL